MTAKQYLQQLINLDMYIKAMKEDYEMVFAQATDLSVELSDMKVQTTKDPHKSENLKARCAQIALDIKRANAELLELRAEARKLIANIEDKRYKTILTLRYLCGMSWHEIATRTDYDVRHTTRLHGEALKEFERVNMS